MNRRGFMLFAGCGALSLSGCAIPTKALTITGTAVSDISLIASGIAAGFPALEASGLVNAKTLATVQGYITQLTSIAGTITNTSSQLQGQSAVQQMETILNAIVAALAGLSLPAPFGPALIAANALLPVVEVAVGLAVSAVAGAPAMSPEAARAALVKAGGHA